MRPHRMGNLLRELRPGLEGVAVAGDERAVVAIHIRERTEAVHLGVEAPVGVVQRLRDADRVTRPILATAPAQDTVVG